MQCIYDPNKMIIYQLLIIYDNSYCYSVLHLHGLHTNTQKTHTHSHITNENFYIHWLRYKKNPANTQRTNNLKIFLQFEHFVFFFF